MESMRILIGWLLEQIFSYREDRGFKKYQKGVFTSLEEMGVWNRYGMTHEQFEEFSEMCTQRAIERYSDYISFFDVMGIDLNTRSSLSRYYFYTEFYKRILRGDVIS